jgi:hypothetical protein
MNISELIKQLEGMRSEHGDLDVVVDEYVGGDYALCDVVNTVDTFSGDVMVVVLDTAYRR